MNRERVIKILTYYRNIDGEIRLCQSMVDDLEGNDEATMTLNKRRSVDFYRRRIETLKELKIQILKEVSSLEYKQKSIVMDHYLYGMIWEQVAARNHYSERQCKNIRTQAIEYLISQFSANKTIRTFKF